MCFSPEMDAAAGILITGLGVDALRRVRKREQVPLALLPVVFGVHQLIETFVWLNLQGHVGVGLGNAATWSYLLIALVVVPVLVPYAFLQLAGHAAPRGGPWFVVAGLLAAVLDISALGLRNVPHYIDGHQITYLVGIPMPAVTLSLYVIATCGPGLASRAPRLQLFGVLNLLVVATLVALNQGGVISLWCVWAAFTSVLVHMHVREWDPDEGNQATVTASGRAAWNSGNG